MQYAVIEARQTEAGLGSERFVLAYRNERSLQDVIAQPRIIAIGFSSREEAAASKRTFVYVAPKKQVPRATVVEQHHHEFHWTERRRETGSALRRLGGFLVTSWSDVVGSAVVIFSSRNILSAAIRMALGCFA